MNKEFAKALLSARQNAKPIIKNATNPFLKNKYADLGAVIESVTDALMKEGILVMQGSRSDGAGIDVETTLLHANSGDSVVAHVYMPLKTSTPQDAAGALTYGRRYGLLSVLCMPTEDDDGNEASGVSFDAKQEPKPLSAQAQKVVNEKTDLVNRLLGAKK